VTSDLLRRVRQASVGHDWFESVSVVLGVLFFVGALASFWAAGVAIATLGDPDPAFKTSLGSLQATRWLGIVLFSLLGFALAGVGWFLAGSAIRRVVRGRRA
jgi:hypothetical protein